MKRTRTTKEKKTGGGKGDKKRDEEKSLQSIADVLFQRWNKRQESLQHVAGSFQCLNNYPRYRAQNKAVRKENDKKS